MPWLFYQILSTHSLRKCIEISLENLYVDIGAWRVKELNQIFSQYWSWCGQQNHDHLTACFDINLKLLSPCQNKIYKGLVIIYVEGVGREKRRGIKAISDWLQWGGGGGGGAKIFLGRSLIITV